ncbi:hypothetical protein KSP40_PGU018959 [Platanthera guangdongensis]|uniref:DJ-1/PfpI domain-containing protein n=1 Tax=Platanthera guangdongensis TaxID=2320717 RepID=A0ABR2LDQ3_9ASPA
MAVAILWSSCSTPLPAPARRTFDASRSTTRRTALAAPSISSPKKKVLVPIGLGTEEIEAVILVDVLRRAGADVTVASVEPMLQIEASSGTKLVADSSIFACAGVAFDLVALPITLFSAV